MNNMHFRISILLIPISFFTVSFLFPPTFLSGEQKKPAPADTITIIGVGDMMLGTLFPAGYLPPNDGKDLLTPVKHILQDADVTFGNCEGTFLDRSAPGKKCDNPSLCYSFRQPERYVNYYAEAGFDVLSIANNHTGDFGEEGRKTTVETIRKAKLHFAGLLTCPYTTFEMKGVKYGFCAFAPNEGTVDIRDLAGAKKIVSHLDSVADVVIVSFHGGAEGSAHTHVKRYNEIFHGENRGNVYEFARAVIDAGADVLLGHGPHVTRAVDLYKDRFIIYGLGNFATYARFNLKGVNGIAPIMKLYLNKKGEFLKGKIYPIKQEGEGGPVPDSTGAVIKEIISLTKADIPEAKLKIEPDGTVLKSNKGIGE